MTKCTKIHRISACDQKHRKTTSMSVKSIALIVTAPNHSKAMADDESHSAAAVICAVVLIIENAIRRPIENDRCVNRTKVKDRMKKNTNRIQMERQAFTGYHQPRREAFKEGQERAVAHHHGMEKVSRNAIIILIIIF